MTARLSPLMYMTSKRSFITRCFWTVVVKEKIKPRRGRILVPKEHAGPFPVLKHLAIALDKFAESRAIPLFIFDASKRPGVAELVRLHEFLGSGDVEVNWARFLYSKSDWTLSLRFIRPVPAVVLIDFDLDDQEGGIIELLLNDRCLYLQPCDPEVDNSVSDLRKRLIVEVPNVSVDEYLRDRVWRHVVDGFRQSGMSRDAARPKATQFRKEWDSVANFRFPPRGPGNAN